MSAHLRIQGGREAVVRAWSDALAASSGASALEGEVSSQRFSNPVAYRIDRTARDVVRFLFEGDWDASVPESIDDVCHVLALEDAEPSVALGSFFRLRQIVLEHIEDEIDRETLLQLDERIDRCVLEAVDRHVRCREQIMQMRIGELKRREKMLERMRETPVTELGEGW